MRVRSATRDDAQFVAPLLTELDYPASTTSTAARLQRLAESEGAGVLVVEVQGAVVALLAFQVIELLERPKPTCRITALVVASAHRRRGAATLLLEAVRSFAESRGCERLEVTTRPAREEALALYLARGFSERPRRLVKYLDG